MQYSFEVRCTPSAWLLGVLLAGCASAHLNDPSRTSEDGGETDAVAAEGDDDDLVPGESTSGASCGNGRIDDDEDCEIGLPGWSGENCSASCRQTLYPNSNLCTFEVGEPFAFYEQGNCLTLPGFSVGCFYLFGQYCQILCSSAEDCPRGFTCNPTPNPSALGPGWCAAQR